ncbi:MAG: TetR/AcrR family transcriptional regulator, partial [Alphaproteobacteria bacterium]
SRRVVPRFEASATILKAALDDLSELGPAGVHPQEICERCGLSKALVNYHFGGRDGLIAEAMALGYERYVDELEAAANAAGRDPFERLVASIDRQVAWTARNPGLAAALNFPRHVASQPAELPEEVFARLNAAGDRNFSNLQRLVADARSSLGPRSARNEPVDAMRIGLDSALVGWMTLGLSVWVAGRHLPTQTLGQGSARSKGLPIARQHMRELLRSMLSR